MSRGGDREENYSSLSMPLAKKPGKLAPFKLWLDQSGKDEFEAKFHMKPLAKKPGKLAPFKLWLDQSGKDEFEAKFHMKYCHRDSVHNEKITTLYKSIPVEEMERLKRVCAEKNANRNKVVNYTRSRAAWHADPQQHNRIKTSHRQSETCNRVNNLQDSKRTVIAPQKIEMLRSWIAVESFRNRQFHSTLDMCLIKGGHNAKELLLLEEDMVYLSVYPLVSISENLGVEKHMFVIPCEVAMVFFSAKEGIKRVEYGFIPFDRSFYFPSVGTTAETEEEKQKENMFRLAYQEILTYARAARVEDPCHPFPHTNANREVKPREFVQWIKESLFTEKIDSTCTQKRFVPKATVVYSATQYFNVLGSLYTVAYMADHDVYDSGVAIINELHKTLLAVEDLAQLWKGINNFRPPSQNPYEIALNEHVMRSFMYCELHERLEKCSAQLMCAVGFAVGKLHELFMLAKEENWLGFKKIFDSHKHRLAVEVSTPEEADCFPGLEPPEAKPCRVLKDAKAIGRVVPRTTKAQNYDSDDDFDSDDEGITYSPDMDGREEHNPDREYYGREWNVAPPSDEPGFATFGPPQYMETHDLPSYEAVIGQEQQPSTSSQLMDYSQSSVRGEDGWMSNAQEQPEFSCANVQPAEFPQRPTIYPQPPPPSPPPHPQDEYANRCNATPNHPVAPFPQRHSPLDHYPSYNGYEQRYIGNPQQFESPNDSLYDLRCDVRANQQGPSEQYNQQGRSEHYNQTYRGNNQHSRGYREYSQYPNRNGHDRPQNSSSFHSPNNRQHNVFRHYGNYNRAPGSSSRGMYRNGNYNRPVSRCRSPMNQDLRNVGKKNEKDFRPLFVPPGQVQELGAQTDAEWHGKDKQLWRKEPDCPAWVDPNVWHDTWREMNCGVDIL